MVPPKYISSESKTQHVPVRTGFRLQEVYLTPNDTERHSSSAHWPSVNRMSGQRLQTSARHSVNAGPNYD